jgi:hypothetical protein
MVGCTAKNCIFQRVAMNTRAKKRWMNTGVMPRCNFSFTETDGQTTCHFPAARCMVLAIFSTSRTPFGEMEAMP